MDDECIEKLSKEVESLKSPCNVLEWGAGGSTIYFTNQLRKCHTGYVWHALEYNRKWFDKLYPKIDENTKLHLFDYGIWTRDDCTKHPMNEYVNFPSQLGLKFDLKFDMIIVDGRKRRRCLLEAKKLLKKDGFVILHDAQRDYYKCALKEYKGEYLTDKLWKGRL